MLSFQTLLENFPHPQLLWIIRLYLFPPTSAFKNVVELNFSLKQERLLPLYAHEKHEDGVDDVLDIDLGGLLPTLSY